MTRLLCLMVAILSMLVDTSIATPACSQCLMDVLESPVCHRQRRLLLTSAQTTINAATTNDKCIDTLRGLLMTSSSVPCAASITNKDASHRRLTVSESGLFSGKLNCTFDKTKPLNLSDLSQNFIIDCKEITKSHSSLLWLWILLGIFGGPIGLWLLWVIMARIIGKTTEWNDHRVERAKERKEAKQKEQDGKALAKKLLNAV